eukprot:12045595-Prorocentrum_lima.AAC.1
MSDPGGKSPGKAAGEPPRLEKMTFEPGAVPERTVTVGAGSVRIKKGDEVGGRVRESLVAEECGL